MPLPILPRGQVRPGGSDTLIERSRLVPSSACSGQRHATERAEGLAKYWREDTAHARLHRRTSCCARSVMAMSACGALLA